MAKKIRFPLQMNGTDVRTIEELRENFDLESVLGYFANGKLVTWLKDRYYDNEAMAVEALSANDSELNQKLMSILGVSADENAEEIDMKTIQRRNEKLMLLRQITDDKEIIDNVDCVAFNQEELNQLLKEGKKKIYLCQGEFEIPICEADVTYAGISNPTVSIVVDDGSNMKLGNVILNNIKCTSDSSDMLVQLGMHYKNGDGVEQDYIKAVEYFKKATDLGNAEAMFQLGNCYYFGVGVQRDYRKGISLFAKSADMKNLKGQFCVGKCYIIGLPDYYLENNYRDNLAKSAVNDEVEEEFRIEAENNDIEAQYWLGILLHYYGTERKSESRKWIEKSANNENAEAQYFLGLMIYWESGLQSAVKWFMKSFENGSIAARDCLGLMSYCVRNVCGFKVYIFYHGGELGCGGWEPSISSYLEAYEWVLKLAEKGDAYAQNAIFWYHKAESSKYENWLLRAAENGCVPALRYLGSGYEYGWNGCNGKRKDMNKANECFKTAELYKEREAREYYL